MRGRTRTLVVCFAGGIGSGKSVVSQRVAETLGWPRVGFGDYVRAVARERGLDETRKTLQEVGAELAARDLEDFCYRVVDQAGSSGQSLIVDGIRHLEVMDAVRRIVWPAAALLIFVDVARDERERRTLERGISGMSFEEAEAHSTEAQVRGRVRDAADLVVDGLRPVEVLVAEITQFVQTHLS